MRIEHEHLDVASPLLRPSYRTRPEQGVGLIIFLLIGAGFFLLNQWLASFALQHRVTVQAPWVIDHWPNSPLWLIYQTLLPCSAWMLWRRLSLRTLKLEISLFLTQFIFLGLWYFCFFYLQKTLPSLVFLPFLLCNALLCMLLFRKKEPFTGVLLLPSVLWIFYILGINMTVCIFNP